jgi:SHS family lactate transporter-like MFS transporter
VTIDKPRAIPAADRANQRNALAAGFLGWTLDAFDFFVLAFVLGPVAKDFRVSIPEVALALTASLATRPLGAIIFGLMADRYGRRLPLMIDILFYSGVEVLSGVGAQLPRFPYPEVTLRHRHGR